MILVDNLIKQLQDVKYGLLGNGNRNVTLIIDGKEYEDFGVQSTSCGDIIITNNLYDLCTYEQALYAE